MRMKIYMSLTWSIFQLQCPLMCAVCLVAELVLSIRWIQLPMENHCQASRPAAAKHTHHTRR